MPRLLIPVSTLAFGSPATLTGGSAPVAADGAKFPCSGLATFLVVTNPGPGFGEVIVRVQQPSRPADGTFPRYTYANLTHTVDADGVPVVIGPFHPAYVNAQGFVELDFTELGDDEGGDGVPTWSIHVFQIPHP